MGFLNYYVGRYAISLLLLSVPAFSLTPIKGELKRSGLRGDTESFTCTLSSVNRVFKLSIDHSSQWMFVENDSGDDFRGVAVRTRTKKGGDEVVWYTMANKSSPYFYDFSLMQNKTSGENRLTLRSGANAFVCE